MALINTAENHDNSGTNFSTISLPATSLTTGNLIVVCFSTFRFFAAAPTGTIADTAGNTYTLAQSAVDGVNGFNAIYVWYCENATGNASNVVTVTYSAQSSYNSIISAQYSGIQTSGSLDTTNSSNQLTSTTSHTSGTFTTAAANEIIIVYAGTQSSVTDTYTAGSGYAIQQVGSTTVLEDKTVGSIQTGVTASITGNNSRTWLMVVATFKFVANVPITESFTDTVAFGDFLQTLLANTEAHHGTAEINCVFEIAGTPTKITTGVTAELIIEFAESGIGKKVFTSTAEIMYEFDFHAIGQSRAVKISCVAAKDLPPSELPSNTNVNVAYMT